MTLARKMSAIRSASARSSGLRMDFDQRGFPRDKFSLVQIHDFDDIDQLVELFDDLFDDSVIPGCDNRHLRHRRIERRRHREAFDIESATAEQACHARQHTKLIFDGY